MERLRTDGGGGAVTIRGLDGWRSTYSDYPSCPAGCSPCGATYYTNGNRHFSECCHHRVCDEQLWGETKIWLKERKDAKREELSAWLLAKSVWEVECQQWVEAEVAWRQLCEAWLAEEVRLCDEWVEAEKSFKATLRPRAPKLVYKKREANAPVTSATVAALKALADERYR
jgi:hypothetical protein